MQKVLKVDLLNSTVLIGDDEIKTMESYPLSEFSFSPQEGDIVRIYKNSDKVFIEKVDIEKKASFEDIPFGYRKVNRLAYLLVAIFFGGLGVHKFIVGKVCYGILYLLLCTIGWITIIGGIIGIIFVITDIVKIALITGEDSAGNVLLKDHGLFES
jgi:TM2 domain-containing membrane protein YozV